MTPPPGTHLIMSVPGRYQGEERYKFGQLALQCCLKAEFARRDTDKRPAPIEFCTSSTGGHKGFTDSFYRSLRTCAKADASAVHVYPSIGKMLYIAEAAKNGVKCWEHEDEMHMRGPGVKWFQPYFPRHHFAHYDASWPHRSQCAHHCKIFAGLSCERELLWQYLGSANFSGAAWGKFEDGGDFIVMSYEMGVFYVPPAPLARDKITLPWATPG